MKRIRFNNTIVLILMLVLCLSIQGCGEAKTPETDTADDTEDLVVVGFSQVGAESEFPYLPKPLNDPFESLSIAPVRALVMTLSRSVRLSLEGGILKSPVRIIGNL